MPEIKNSFQKGVMNKDLDERLIPNGQYKDAMNVQVSTSEESGVGTVQNILGNIRVEDTVSISDAKCVGAIADEKNNVLYWFITSPTVDAIVEYRDDPANQSTNTCIPVLVDTNKNVLKFNPANLITGINIIDNLLFWTDNVNEPRKINIDTLKLNNYTDLTTHSQMFVNDTSVGDVTEDHITVIRKRPQKAPTVTFSETTIQPQYTFEEFSLFNLNTTDSLTVYLETNSDDPYDVGNILLLLESDAIGNLPVNYQIKVEVTSKTSNATGWDITFDIIEMDKSYGDLMLMFDVVREVDTNVIFEKEFVRFATRYKYIDGEYSAFSPFTQPVFLAGSFGFHPTKDPYNLGMENKAVSIKLQDLIPTDVPSDVVQLDILFKKERSTTIYSIDSIKKNDPTPNYWNKNDYANRTVLNSTYPPLNNTTSNHDTFPYSYTGEYELTTENIYAALPDNQILRPWDNVPRKALSQEITTNRVIYGNYLQNYNLKNLLGNTVKPNLNVGYEQRTFTGVTPSFTNSEGMKSIKSLRTYYLGVVYGDEYGRETPVFTSKDASIKVPYDMDDGDGFNGAPDKSLRLTAKLLGEQPEWAYYYKYFVKQTTGEYYNLTVDRVYKSVEDQSLWISLPSSDRNKIQEGDYFTIKKQVDLEQIVPVDPISGNKIKVIDIKNEAPESVKYSYYSLGTGGGSQVDLNALFPDPSSQPGPATAQLLVDRKQWIETENGVDISEALTKSDRLAIQFEIAESGTTLRSKKYFVSAYNEEDGGDDGRWRFALRETIDQADGWVESSPGVLNGDKALQMVIYKLEQKEAVEFEGRFFVKVISNPITQTYLIPASQDINNYQSLGIVKTFNVADKRGTTGSGGSYGVWNTENSNWTQTTAAPLSDLESEWVANTVFDGSSAIDGQGWFVDSAGFVATQQQGSMLNSAFTWETSDVASAYSGNMNLNNHAGTITSGQFNGNISQYVNGLEGIISPDQTSGPYAMSANIPAGFRHWNKNITGGQITSAGTQYPSPFISDPDNTYVPVAGGGHWMHLSFAGPGYDLHSGSFNAAGLNSDFDSANGYTGGSEWDFLNAMALNMQLIFPGNGNWGEVWENNDPEDKEKTNRQFDPTFAEPGNISVVNNLVAGRRFKMEGDDTNIYTIMTEPSVKWLYNHTAYHYHVTYNSPITNSPTTSWNNHSVDKRSVWEAIEGLFDFIQNGGSGTGQYQKWVDLKDIVTRFGAANNRRTCYILQLDKDPRLGLAGTTVLDGDLNTFKLIRFIDNYIEPGSNTLPISPSVLETEAKEDADLNVYYEASDALPVKLDEDSNSLKGHLLGPVGSKVSCDLAGSMIDYSPQNGAFPDKDFYLRVVGWEGNEVELNNPGLKWHTSNDLVFQTSNFLGNYLTFWKEDSSYTTAKIIEVTEITDDYITKVKLDLDVYKEKAGLPYYNCFSFGNGVESNRIRDDFNESYILNGVKASTVLEEPYEEERRKYGLIYSGLYNSTSGINNLNQFIQAEKITKDLMPIYGSIQKLYARDKDLITLCEDKILQIFVDRDVLFNADGNAQLLSTDRVLGEANPFRGNYGISKNPESFAAESFRAYFTDKQRGAVLRLSMDGLTPISDAGMHDYFRDNLKDGGSLYGSYDSHKGNYNLSILLSSGENLLINPGFNQGGAPTEVYSSELLSNWDFSATTDITTTYASNYARTMHYSSSQARLLGVSTTGSTTDPTTVIPTATIQWTVSSNPLVMIGDDVKSPGPVGMSNPPIVGTVTAVYPPSSYPGTYTVAISVTPGIYGTAMNNLLGSGNWPVYDPNAVHWTTGAVVGYWHYPVPAAPGFEFERPQTTVVTGQTIDDWTYPGFEFDTYSAIVTGSNAWAFHEDTNPELSPMLQHNTYNLQAGKRYKASFSMAPNVTSTGVVQTIGDNLALHDYTFENGETYSTTFDINTGGYPFVIYQQTGDQVLIKDVSLKEVSYTGGVIADWNIFPNLTSEVYFLPVSNLSPTGPGYIEFDDASVDSGIEQFLSKDYPIGTSFTASFNITDLNPAYSAEIIMYMYNSAGYGFEHTFDRAGNYSITGIISDSVSAQSGLYTGEAGGALAPSGWNLGPCGVFGFRVETNYPYKFQLDDVSLIVNLGQGSTVSYNETVKGWTSFKSFVPETGISCVNQYYTMNFGQLWKHHVEQFDSSGKEINRNTFYSEYEESSITPILNMQPEIVKNFNTLNYEGSQSKVDQWMPNDSDGEYYNLQGKQGWYVSSVHTDKQEGTLNEFIEKEGKWFNYIKGTPDEIDTGAFNFQGLGIVETID